MVHAIRVHTPGGPDAMMWESVEVGEPGPGEVRLSHTAVGVNYIDVYHRTGLYPVPAPFTPGLEAAGLVEAVGPGVTEVQPGDRVAYNAAPIGAYAQARLYPADRLVPIPDEVSHQQAASVMLQGMTAWYLLRRVHRVQPGETILVTAAAGGVGTILCAWASFIGATVIGVVSNEAKAETARAHGCAHPLIWGQDDVVAQVKGLTGGVGVPVVYDSVGKDTFMTSLDCLATRGMMVSFGNASGPVPAIEPLLLAQKGSLFLTRPILAHYTEQRSDLLDAAEDLFHHVKIKAIPASPRQIYSLRDAPQAHRDLEARKTTGSTILIP